MSKNIMLGVCAISTFLSVETAFALSSKDDIYKEAATSEFKKSSRSSCLEGYPCFAINNAYPDAPPEPTGSFPWQNINFKVNPEEYLMAVLGYVVEGNIEKDWDVSRNETRKWYHAPWMHNQREPIRGLTRERGSRWHELSPQQIRRTNNWAIGFYNVYGGSTFGKVWQYPERPNTKEALFPVGTVTAKLLFTDATDEEAPYLKGNDLAWEADINNNGRPTKLRLLQVDVAVKEKANQEHSGWIFGTFVFDGRKGEDIYWKNLIPVGLEWGNSPLHTFNEFSKGLLPSEGWVNPKVAEMFRERAPDSRMGYLGRMNGPVDSPLSSCMSCHSRAIDTRGEPAPAFNPTEIDMCIKRIQTEQNNETYIRIDGCEVKETTIGLYYRNLKSDEPFIAGFNSLDYSLQMALGIANWNSWLARNFPDESNKVFLSTRMKVFPLKESITTGIPMLPAIDAFHRGD